ncbi:hypothetical protein EDB84DRAFT_1439545 [Lactarius hengduanensis]|nr:hypothetical protein EDB84DRAFT_1439545 [Lactarius hengduanensis]
MSSRASSSRVLSSGLTRICITGPFIIPKPYELKIPFLWNNGHLLIFDDMLRKLAHHHRNFAKKCRVNQLTTVVVEGSSGVGSPRKLHTCAPSTAACHGSFCNQKTHYAGYPNPNGRTYWITIGHRHRSSASRKLNEEKRSSAWSACWSALSRTMELVVGSATNLSHLILCARRKPPVVIVLATSSDVMESPSVKRENLAPRSYRSLGINRTVVEEAYALRPHPIPAEPAHGRYGGVSAPRTLKYIVLRTRKVVIRYETASGPTIFLSAATI